MKQKAFNRKEAMYIPKYGMAPMLLLEFLRDNRVTIIQVCSDVIHSDNYDYIPIKLSGKASECTKYINANL
mgnify:CR=1 FL=1